jgi:hypothetical protein
LTNIAFYFSFLYAVGEIAQMQVVHWSRHTRSGNARVVKNRNEEKELFPWITPDG